MGLFERVFRGSDEMFAKAEADVNALAAELGPDAPMVMAAAASLGLPQPWACLQWLGANCLGYLFFYSFAVLMCMNLLLDNFKPYGQSVIDALNAYAQKQPGWQLAPDNFEGVRVNLDKAHGDGWFLLRLSLHDPLMPLNIESDSAGGVLTIARELLPFLQGFDKLDTAALAAFAG